MLKGLRELADLALGLCFDLVELVTMLQIPVIASATQGPDKIKALQLSAFITIAILIVWSTTTHQMTSSTQQSWLTIGIVSTLYLSIAAWLVYNFLQATSQYATRSDIKADALSVVLSFNFIVIVIVTAIIQSNHYIDRRRPFHLNSLDGWDLYGVLLVLPVAIAGTLTLANSLRYLRGHPAKSTVRACLQIGAFTVLNVILADLFVYLMYVFILGT